MLRLAFMGTPDFAVPVLSEILGQGHDVACVYTQPPRKAGRGQAERPSPVQAFAESMGLPVRTPESLRNAEEKEAFAALELDAAVVVAYGLILPKAILEAPEHGCLNLHASLLPRWRGAAPIQRAIMAGDSETGVMVMQMEKGLDTGPILLAERVAITPTTTAGSLHDQLSQVGATLMSRALAALSRGGLDATPQPSEGVTYAEKIDKAEARVDWRRCAQELDRHIRGLTPFPGAYFEAPLPAERGGAGKTERIKIIRARPIEGMQDAAPGTVLDDALTVACGEGALELLQVQRAGKGAVDAQAFLRGFALLKGTVLP